MESAGKKFVGEHDFRNFCKMDAANVQNYKRHVTSFDISPCYIRLALVKISLDPIFVIYSLLELKYWFHLPLYMYFSKLRGIPWPTNTIAISNLHPHIRLYQLMTTVPLIMQLIVINLSL